VKDGNEAHENKKNSSTKGVADLKATQSDWRARGFDSKKKKGNTIIEPGEVIQEREESNLL